MNEKKVVVTNKAAQKVAKKKAKKKIFFVSECHM
jgi:hypothetical protein